MHALMFLAVTLIPLFASLIVSAEWGRVWRAVFIGTFLSLLSLAILIFIELYNEGGLILIATVVGLPFIFGFAFVGTKVGWIMHQPSIWLFGLSTGAWKCVVRGTRVCD